MKHLLVSGGGKLRGEVHIQGAKNSVLPILAATVLHRGVSILEGCPHLSDVETAISILRELGAKTAWQGHTLRVDAAELSCCTISESLMRQMRSSVIFLGALLARFGEAEVFYPGGCQLGSRPIDLHLRALSELGAEITVEGGSIKAKAKKLLKRSTPLNTKLGLNLLSKKRSLILTTQCSAIPIKFNNFKRSCSIEQLLLFC